MTKTHLITGGCGFIGRNLTRRLLSTTTDRLLLIDNLSNGIHPDFWLNSPVHTAGTMLRCYEANQRIIFIKSDIRTFLQKLKDQPKVLDTICNDKDVKIHDVYHFAAIVGGRKNIDHHPLSVASNLAVDSDLFNWACDYKPERLLYPSSSAVYPVHLQEKDDGRLLCESDIDFNNFGKPDNTYGWAKLTGEYLARIAAERYGLHVTCIRPFSGYGEDQDLDYPIPALATRAIMKKNPFEVWGSGLQKRDFVHVSDVLDCIEVAMNTISDGSAINIGTGRLSSFVEVIEILTSFANYTPVIKPHPEKPVGVFSRGGEMTEARMKLNWSSAISLEEGLRRVFDNILIKKVQVA